MLLKSIKFKDFRCFVGETIVEFPCDEERNVVVILGENTHGKSTIVQAFAWCFYGESNFENPEIYNRGIARELPIFGRTKALVEVQFEHEISIVDKDDEVFHGKTIYTARRTQEFYKASDGKMRANEAVFKLEYINPIDGQTKPCGERTSEMVQAINSILDKALAQYFFFAGEKDHVLTTKSLGGAVKNLLGIDALTNMKLHLYGDVKNGPAANSVLGVYERLQEDLSNVEAQREWNKKEEAEKALEKINSDLAQVVEDISKYDRKIEEINTILREAAPTKAIQQRRDQISNDLKRENYLLERAYVAYLEEFNNKAVGLFTYPLLNRARAKLQAMDLSDKGIKGIESIAIEELLNRGVCLCGTDLREGTSAYKEVAKYLDILPPKSVGVLVRHLQDTMTEYEDGCKEYVSKVESLYRDIQLSIKRIHDLERDEKEALEELRNSPSINTQQYEADLRQYKIRVANCRDEERRLIARRQTEQNKLETAKNNFNMHKAKSNKNQKYVTCYAYAQAVYKWLSETYNEKETSVRKALETNVTELFNKIYSGNRKVTIDENYNISIYPMADTGGVKAIQYFSYVGGLVQLACKAMQERSSGDLSGGEFPLVLDAAFSHTDRMHTKSIALELSKVTKQLIFAVMDKDWEHVADDISYRIYKTYKLRKTSEDEVVIEEA